MNNRWGQVIRQSLDGIVVLTIDNSGTKNALSSHLLEQLTEHIDAASRDPACRGLVVTGAGSSFSSGEDLRETQELLHRGGTDLLSTLFDDVTEAVVSSTIPCLAALNGPAVGGAAGLALCFDRRIAVPSAGMCFPESRVGFTVSNATSMLLPAVTGRATAMDLVLSGRMASAAECSSLGLIDEVVAGESQEPLLQRCRVVIDSWTPPGNTTKLHLRLLRPDLDALRAAFAVERIAAAEAWNTGSMSTQIARFDKQAPE